MSPRGGYKPEPLPPVRNGVCTKHGERVGAVTGICLSCHHEGLEAAGFDWRSIGSLRPLAEGAAGWRARHEEAA